MERNRPARTGQREERFDSATVDSKRRVVLELQAQLGGLSLPAPVQQFLVQVLGPWMVVRLRRYGDKSPPWIEARIFAAAFCDLLRPAGARDRERRRSARNYALVQVKSRMQRSVLRPDEQQRLFSELDRYFSGLNTRERLGEAAPVTTGDDDLGFLQAISD